MRNFFWFYYRFTGTIFFLWLFLWLVRKLGFDFALDLPLFFRLFFFLFLILVVWEIRIRWSVISPLIKTSFLKIKNEFIFKTEATQKEIISSSPKILTGRIGSFLTLVLAIGISFFSFFWGFTKALIVFIFHPRIIIILMVLGILADIFVFSFTSGLIILLLTGFWVWIIHRYKLKGEFSVAGGLIFLTMCPFLLFSQKRPIAEKAAIWAYVFLAVGVIQMFIEHLREEKRDAKIKAE
jgi:hypothetical protein